MMVILGGMGKLHGAVLGAIGYVLLQEVLSSPAWLGSYAKHWQLGVGSLIVLIVLVLPHGLAGWLERTFAWYKRRTFGAAAGRADD
jgi:branched-chain amino acid transport system permease protein